MSNKAKLDFVLAAVLPACRLIDAKNKTHHVAKRMESDLKSLTATDIDFLYYLYARPTSQRTAATAGRCTL